jgi:hypothetical protein
MLVLLAALAFAHGLDGGAKPNFVHIVIDNLASLALVTRTAKSPAPT